MKELSLFAAILFFVAAVLRFLDKQPETSMLLVILSVAGMVMHLMVR